MTGSEFLIGTYTGSHGAGRGIYRTRRRSDGTMTPPELVAEQASPSYLALPGGRSALYAAREERGGAVLSYDVGHGPARHTGTVDVPAGPCHLAVHPDGGLLLVASYQAGSVSMVRLDAAGRVIGVPSIAAGRHGAHAHAVAFAPDGTVLSTDLGADLVRTHRIDKTVGTLRTVAEVPLPSGSGPRHLVVHPSGYLYVLTELSGALIVLAAGNSYADLTVVGESPATASDAGGDALGAAIKVGAGGTPVYTTARGPGVVTAHEVRAEGAALRPVADVACGGRWPRDLCLDGRWLHVANEHSGDLASFRVDTPGGVPEPVGSPTPAPAPACVVAS